MDYLPEPLVTALLQTEHELPTIAIQNIWKQA